MNISMQTIISTCLLTFLLPHSGMAASLCTGTNSSTPNNRFTTDNAAGTVTDIKTGLMWKRCSEGQAWNSSAGLCDASAESIATWQDALAKAQSINFAGKADWRVPNIKELASIVEIQCSDPAINEVIFPGTPSAEYWTSSPSIWPQQGSVLWSVNFRGGTNFMSSLPKFVRLVRNSQ